MGDGHFEIAGWLLFVGSAVFFLIASWRAGDGIALIGSLLFLIACFVFLIPFARRWRGRS